MQLDNCHRDSLERRAITSVSKNSLEKPTCHLSCRLGDAPFYQIIEVINFTRTRCIHPTCVWSLPHIVRKTINLYPRAYWTGFVDYSRDFVRSVHPPKVSLGDCDRLCERPFPPYSFFAVFIFLLHSMTRHVIAPFALLSGSNLTAGFFRQYQF